jgi:GTP-binding protein
MIIKTSNYAISAVKASQYPQDGRPEIALAGRSNVGKSSLINAFLGRRNLARTSSQPGKTQTLNFYQVNDEFYLVDVPGYGYARVSQKQRQAFGQMIQDYLETRANLVGLIILIDARHEPTKDDQAMYNYATYLQLPLLVVCTKIDKVKKSQQQQALARIKKSLAFTDQTADIMTFSSATKTNLSTLQAWVERRLKE